MITRDVNSDDPIVRDTVEVGDDPFIIEVEKKRDDYIATIYFSDQAVLRTTSDTIRGASKDALEELYGSFITEKITVRDNEYPGDIYEFGPMYYVHIRGPEDGYGFGVEKRRAIDKAIDDMKTALGPQTLDEIDLSMEKIRAKNQLESLRSRMEQNKEIDWRYVDIEYVEGDIEEAKQYYGLQNDQAIHWIDQAIERVSQE